MTTTTPSLADGGYEFRPEDRPSFPGGPFSPPHPPLRRLAYAAIGLWIGATTTFVNATVTVNVPNLSGEHAAYVAELSWLPAIYVAANSCANTMLVKARAQFSMPGVMRALLLVYIAIAAAQFFLTGFAAEAVVRFVSGVVAGGMTTTGIYYLLQVVPPKARAVAMVTGLGMTQLGTPLARLIPVDLLSEGGWFGQHCLELATGITTLTLITLLPLPPTPRSKLFQPLDFVTVALLLPAVLMICGVLNRGRLAWWTDTPWLGVVLAIAIPLLAAAIAIEASRERPLIQVGWIGTRDFLGFIAIAFLMRLALAEQTYGAVGLLTAGNLDNDQLRTLFCWVIVSMLAGIVACVLTVSERAIPRQVIVASLAIAAGAWMDSRANDLTRPEQLYLSQSLIGFGTCLFIGPTMAHGILKVMRLGADYFVTLVVVFSMTQNIGGLVGSALLGSYQTIATRAHFQELAERMPAGDVQVANRVAGSTRALACTVADPALRAQQGGAALVASMTREATVLAFNDVFRLVWRLALATALLVVVLLLLAAVRPIRRTEPT
ncbi:MFS transporter [Scleromatobacter humisilvae]|uniref:MFS transporter n=1 Tax=Scleromatobacter humisilvae TaxID=2897159 RepID=A0A9X1YLK1_9BURK|nr:MFS transporter [Scleromatobacter humisilvae]MCK9687130.1 MFS transporter [Scleromatobacter humisilvae]